MKVPMSAAPSVPPAPPTRAASTDSASEANRALVRRATVAAVATATSLVVLKLVTWLATGSVALLSSFVDSLLDLAASGINLLAVRTAQSPPDAHHRFGHGKAEPIAALAQAAFITGSAVFVFAQAAARLVRPSPVEASGWGVAVMLTSIAATLTLVRLQRRAALASGSLAVEADALHYTGDILANAAVIGALLLGARPGWERADPLVSLVIAAFILKSAIRIGRRALDMLMDHEIEAGARARLVSLLDGHPGVPGWHDLRTRQSGPQVFVQVHLELDPALSLAAAHAIADEVEAAIHAILPGSEAIVHQDVWSPARERRPG